MKLAAILSLVLVIQAAVWPPVTEAQASCRFVLGFATLRDVVGTQKVGACLEDEHFNLENGNAEQRTSGGLLVWRKVDNFTAFTDGGTTWVNGPSGLQSRPNGDRFSWERDPVQSAPVPQPTPLPASPPQRGVAVPTATPITAPTPRVVPTSTPAAAPIREAGPDPMLMSRCVGLAADLAEQIGGNAFEPLLGLCQSSVKDAGARGFSCFETAFRRAARSRSSTAGQLAEAEYRLCISTR
jgi:hypothetical protein